ncbi:MAG: ABC transporter permease [Acidobacteriia bacterium]|nr:ABC transporter permease [Terriglobia bacterium]
MDTLWQDIKFGFRVLAKNPAFTLVSVLTLGLGIGANTGIFSVVRAVLLRPLPYRQPEAVMQLWETKVVPRWDRRFIAVGNFMAWREQNHVFEQMALLEPDQINLTGSGNPDNVSGLKTSANVFSLLGVSPVLGRGFLTEDETEQRHVVVLSDSLWRRLGASPNIIGQVIHLDEVPYTVIGVLPGGFYLPEPGDPAQLWVPLKLEPQELSNHRDHGYLAVARLKPGVSLGQAQAEMDGIARRLETESVQWNTGSGIRVLSMREQLAGRIRPALMILMGAVGFVLLIACANVANLLLASGTARKKEMVMRAALGAPRHRLVRQLLTESTVLATMGACAGIALSKLLVEALPRLLPPDLLLEIRGVEMDASVLGFTVILSLLTVVIFGLAPSWLATRTEINESLKFSDAHVSPGGRHFLYWMQVGQVAVTLTLLAGAGLLIKSLWRLEQVNPGFDAGGVLTADLFLPETRYTQGGQIARFQDELMKKIEGLPGVRFAALTNVLPLAGRGGISFSIEGHPEPPHGTYIANEQRFVTADYFKTLQIPLLRGRTFTDQDTSQSPLVTIINETIARQFFANEDPIGKRIKWSRLDDQNFPWWFTIIGVVGDTREIALESPPLPELYMFTPQIQGSMIPWGHRIGLQAFLITRTENDPVLLSTVMPKLIWGLDRDVPITHFQAYKQVVETSVAQPRMITLLLTLFSGLALVISITGLYGVISYAVSQRTREIGIRIAIGAQPGAVLNLFLRSGLRMAFAGVSLGLLGTWAGLRFMSGFLYAVSPTDKVILGLVCAVLILVSALASLIPARRATKIDPIAVLRCE